MMTLISIVGSVSVHATEKDATSITTLEKNLLSPTTKKVQYKKGKITSTSATTWKSGTKVSKKATQITLSKKGWYTICATKNSGKRKLAWVYFYAQTYEISMNTKVKKTEGYYYLMTETDTTKVVKVKGSSSVSGAAIRTSARSAIACQVWVLEHVSGAKYRLKNANSGLYLACTGKKNKAVQQTGLDKDKAQIFMLYDAGSGATYIKNTKTGYFLHIDGNKLEFTTRQHKKAWKYTWEETTKPESSVMIKKATYPTTLDEGSAFSLRGKITSCYSIQVLTAGVYDKSGSTVLEKKIYPTGCRTNLKKVDDYISFGSLDAGSYQYKVTVRDVTGTDTNVIDRSFVVGAIISTGGKTLSYDSSLIATIGHQSTGTTLEKKACASYALAYCNAILSGTTPSPHDYWSSSTNVDCVWSKGGYTTKSYSSEQAVLKAAVTQIAAGKPCILHVTGSTAQHWIAVIGYKDYTGSTLSVSHLVAIDPWDGQVITVSSRYKVKSTYRLGVKS